MLNKIIKYVLYGLVFLFPLFFLPVTIFPIAANKQMLVSVFVFLLLLLWLIKIMISGKISFVKNKLTAVVLLFILIQGISTIFSGAQAQSFWGMSFEPDSFFSFLLCVLGFFIVSNLANSRKIIKTFLLSSGLLALFFLVQLFVKTLSFNPVGTVQALSILFGAAFVILLTLKTTDAKKSILQIILGILLFASILLINFRTVWFLLILSMVLIVWFKLKQIQPGTNPMKSALILPFVILAISLVFIFINIPTQKLTNLPTEISLTNRASIGISQKTIQDSTKNLFLGSGPATFGYNYDLHRSQVINFTDFWAFRFEQGKSFLTTTLANSGLLGIISILLIIIAFFWQGFKTLISMNQPNQHKSAVNTAVFIGSAYFLITWFFYPANFTLMFTTFLMLGLFTTISINQPKSASISVTFTKSPQLTFFIMLVGVFLLVGMVVGIYKVGERYAGAIVYAEALKTINAPEPNLDEGLVKITKAIELDAKNDSYFRNLSQAFLIKINNVLSDGELTQEQKQQMFQALVNNIEAAGNMAIQLNPLNSQNWFQAGSIYENFLFLGVEGSGQMAVANYQKAKELSPQSPQFTFSLGRTYKLMAEKIGEEDENYQATLDLAISELQKTLQLKPDFTPATQLLEEIESND